MSTASAFAPNLHRIKRDITTLVEFTSPSESGYTRISFSDEDRCTQTETNVFRKTIAGTEIGREMGRISKEVVYA
jgi:hypothetical protein